MVKFCFAFVVEVSNLGNEWLDEVGSSVLAQSWVF